LLHYEASLCSSYSPRWLALFLDIRKRRRAFGSYLSQIYAQQLLNRYGLVPFGGPCHSKLRTIGAQTFRYIECRSEDAGSLNSTLWGLAIGEQIYTSRVTTKTDVGGKVFDFSEDGTDVIACSVEVGGELCDSCEACSTGDGTVGSNVTCSFSPELDTNGPHAWKIHY
jgi:hypothetical protein